ncbi:triose-phosphate isomerase [Microlunatus lacustris]
MTRKPLMAGNWKMNLNHVEATGLVQKLAWTLSDQKWDPEQSEVVVLPPFTDLRTVQTLVDGDRLTIGYGAQDLSPFESGAYTGDISADMLVKLGCRYVLVGHSERRQYHDEDDNTVNAKAIQAVSRGITPIICVGEGLEVREAADHVRFTLAHVENALANLAAEQIGACVIAYEPVWAIGTGRVATPGDAQEVCSAIRAWVRDQHGAAVADTLRILYGGSVKSGNVADIMSQPDVDGCLVGGASLQIDEFSAIARFYDLPTA